MKYKTTIELVTEAKDKNEAIEIAGEYLSGNIMSGVDMKCLTRPVMRYGGKVIASISVSLALVIVGFVVTLQTKTVQNVFHGGASISAVQPPLKTSSIEKKDSSFKKEWEDKQTRQMLDYIKR